MTTKTVTLHIHKRIVPPRYPWDHDIEISCHDLAALDCHRGDLILVGTHEVEVPIPEEDVTAQAIEALKGRAETVMAQARAEAARIHEQIHNLQCLEHKEES